MVDIKDTAAERKLLSKSVGFDSPQPTIVYRKITAIPKKIGFLAFFLAIFIISMVAYSFYNGVRMVSVYTPLIDAAMEIKLEATTAHLWFEEILSGDVHEDMDVVLKHIDQADWYARAMLEGGKNEEGTFIPLDDAKMRRQIREVRERLEEFRYITRQRFSKKESSGAGTDIDQRYDAIFTVFVNEADEVETRLQEIIVKDLTRFQMVQIVLILSSLMMSALIGIAAYRFQRLRAKDYHALQESNTRLKKEVRERLQAEADLKNSQEQLRNLSNRLQSIREEEKTRIAREVHDELGQSLTALDLDLIWLENKLAGQDKPVLEKIQSMCSVLESTIERVQTISAELRPQILDILGLCAALKWQANQFQNRTGIQCHLECPSHVYLDPERSTAFYRIFQESLTNIVRHSKADRVRILFKIHQNNMELTITDNGQGIDKGKIGSPTSMGLIGIRERALFLGGKVHIWGKPGVGTTVFVSIPA